MVDIPAHQSIDLKLQVAFPNGYGFVMAHALQLTDAMSAGKDAYCEKPLGNSIAECRAMVAAKQRHNRVVQVGQWQREVEHGGGLSSPPWPRALSQT